MKVDDEEVRKNKRLEKKRRLKERFDTEYDDGDATYFDDLKEEMQKQAEVRCWIDLLVIFKSALLRASSCIVSSAEQS